MTPEERAKKGQTLALQKIAERTQVVLATAMGVSETTITRIKNDHMEQTLLLLAHLGLKVVPSDFKCVSRETYDFLTATHQRVMQVAPELVWDAED